MKRRKWREQDNSRRRREESGEVRGRMPLSCRAQREVERLRRTRTIFFSHQRRQHKSCENQEQQWKRRRKKKVEERKGIS